MRGHTAAAAHRHNNTLAAIKNYASLATTNLLREIVRDGLATVRFSDVLADLARIGQAAGDALPAAGVPTDAPDLDLRDERPISYSVTPAQGGQGLTVLVVDDDPLVRDSVGRLLQMEGYEVIEAADASEALAISSTHVGRIDLLLTDYAMPGGGGGDLAAALELGRPDTKVLFMTGYGHRAFVRQGLVGRGNVIHKPFSARDLYSKVAATLSKTVSA